MGDVADGFANLVGRQATEAEKQRLYQVRDALGLANNDALWLVLVALEHYDSLYRAYPETLARRALDVLEAQRRALAETVAAETAKVQRTLADAVVGTSEEIAGRRAEAARWQAWALVAAALVLFGGLCVACGCAIGTGAAPFWAARGGGRMLVIARAILAAPAGWTCFALLVPVAAYYGWAGIVAARDVFATRRERVLGGLMAAGCAVAAGGCAVVIAMML